ncbi:OST-HTH/LOTUS domain-containing protein [Mameliella alba]|nr:OST-HTH/LOTUS domain-containing protein [Mameliella alba]MBY6167880.1 OST-HTH/LOTUS domain-containing protein [Mameliella alba]MBY6172901.1 OST-HTH/LOTUS domain-containing protein [Mameliella alba]
MTSLNDEDLPQLQQEVQRLLGRCMLRLQQYERLIKILIAHHTLSGPIHDLERVRTARIDGTVRKTLGSLVGELIGSYVVPDEIKPTEDAMADTPEAPVSFAMHMTVRYPVTDFARLECELREMVDLRNNLVHHFIDQHDIGSLDGCHGAQDALVAAYSSIDRHLTQLREWVEDMEKLRLAAAEVMQTQAFRDCFIKGVSSDGSVNWYASGIVNALREAFQELAGDGWAPLAEAVKWITARQPEQLPTKYGCKSWRQVVHKAPTLELRYFVVDGERSAFYRPNTSP